MSEFCHLHCHSEYSLLDGMSRLEDMVLKAKELNQPAIALTDHGVMFGAIEFYRAAKRHGIKPIMGLEAYMARRTMESRQSDERRPFHMLLLAQNQIGYQNLLKLSSIGQLEGFYQKPRIDRESLAKHAEGVIATTGCLAAEVPRTLVNEGEKAAYEKLKWYLDVFGRDRFFLELQGHDIPELKQVNNVLLDWSRKYEVGLIATNDVHYVNKTDAGPHEVLLCMQTHDVLSNPKRMQITPHGSYYITSSQEMAQMFSHYPDALKNTIRIAEMCEVDLDSKGYHLPIFPVPEGYDAESYLRHLVEKGLVERYGEYRAKQDPVVRERIERELRIIHNMGFDTYFLIVWDLCQFAARSDIWWNVRGSGAGSVVAYTLRITNIDAIKNDLIFERFLNPDRVSMPDFDLDFPDDRRHRMIEYAVEKYGKEKCAAIITFGTLGAKAAVRDVGRTFGMTPTEVNRLAAMIPSSGKVKLKKVLLDESGLEEWPVEAASIREAYQQDVQIKKVLDTAMKLEGQTRHASTHAAGIVISDKPIVEYAPLHRSTKGDDSGPIQQVVQFDMNIVESIGLLKVDFLGLATLAVMRRACEHIAQRHGRQLNLNNIPYERNPDDPEYDANLMKAYELLQRGETVGVFQVESDGLRRVLQDMLPNQFEHIIAAISLYRPGPLEYIPTYIERMHGREEVAYHHPLQEPILKNTYGICVYQEQIMRMASDIAGYSPGEADLMRRAVSKKKEKDIEKHKQIFIEGASQNGVDRKAAEKIYGEIEYFARYGFNKSHAADYAVITVQTAYLKAHYPVEYLCALLEVEFDDTAKVPVLINECRRLGIDVLPPDINASGARFTIEENPKNKHLPKDNYRRWGIRVGLGAIKNVGLAAVEQIIEERSKGAFKTLDEFCERVDLRSLNRRIIECLGKVGSFDDLVRPLVPDTPREVVTHKDVIDRMIGVSSSVHAAASIGQLSMFDMMMTATSKVAGASVLKPLPKIGKVDPKKRLDDEKELLGIYISEHPLQQVASQVGKNISHFCSDITEELVEQSVVIAGLLIDSPRVITTKKGQLMAFIKLEDLKGQMEVVVFPRTYEQAKDILIEDDILLVRGKVNLRNDSLSVLADQIQSYQAESIHSNGTELLSHVVKATNGWHVNGTASSSPEPQEKPEATQNSSSMLEEVQFKITLTMERTEDHQQDILRLNRVMGALREYRGRDKVELRCLIPNGDIVQLDFPKLKITWNATLKDIIDSQNMQSHVKEITPIFQKRSELKKKQRYRQKG